MTAPTAQEPTVDIQEREAWRISGWIAVLVLLLFIAWLAVSVFFMATGQETIGAINLVVSVVLAVAPLSGLVLVSPGEAKVIEFFGAYIGTVRTPGFWLVRPFSVNKKVSVKVHNFETSQLKVNDADGNPIDIAAIVVWQVDDTAQAQYAVEDHQDFVHVQAEAALRHVAMSHPYDNDAHEITLRGDTEVIAREMADEVAARIALAGLKVVETRISSLAYAPEIAQAMLQRQQASAIIAAREKIVEGAVSMVQDALTKLEEQNVVTLDDERRAAMVSNLLVVLCGDSRATPIVNTGSLYQ